MREIKFRSFVKAEQRMIYGRDAMSVKKFTPNYAYLDSEVEVMQYTGLKDSTKWESLTENEREEWTRKGNFPSEWNGKEIYEADIVKYLDAYDCSTESGYDFSEFDNTGVIEWEEELRYSVTNRETIDLETFWESEHIEVIGNIYENPELLER